jgi:hypothetical protein
MIQSELSAHEKQRLKKGESTKMKMDKNDDLLPEYDLDYKKSRPNRFAAKYQKTQRTVVLDDDIAENFPSAESVNEALRFLIRVTRENQNSLQNK